MVFHIWGHMRILINDMETFRRPSNKITIDLNIQDEFFSDDEGKLVARDMANIVQQHNKITK